MAEERNLKDRISKTSDADFARQCGDLLFDVENEYWLKVSDFFRQSADGLREIDNPSLEWAQCLVRSAIEDLEKLDCVLEAKKELI